MDKSDTRDNRKDNQRKKPYMYKSYRQRAAENAKFLDYYKAISEAARALRDKLDKDS